MCVYVSEWAHKGKRWNENKWLWFCVFVSFNWQFCLSVRKLFWFYGRYRNTCSVVRLFTFYFFFVFLKVHSIQEIGSVVVLCLCTHVVIVVVAVICRKSLIAHTFCQTDVCLFFLLFYFIHFDNVHTKLHFTEGLISELISWEQFILIVFSLLFNKYAVIFFKRNCLQKVSIACTQKRGNIISKLLKIMYETLYEISLICWYCIFSMKFCT